ncbi:tRNA-uridine aminocarboxypropyltransferase [Marinobacter sp. VGCF2001]|uniref:tRNA-uridine aminocarboxypropyltransferase n=1 Tax=Marinobacter sp. VGCF2001 TaxID=3417189 RepID=UPI003CF0786E
MARIVCPRCDMHPNICVCADCEPVPNRQRVIVLQHPTEVGHAKGTVRVLRQCLEQLEVLVGDTRESFARQGLEQMLSAGRTGLLFPAPDSQPVDSSAASNIDQWLVLDGTWRKAAKLLHLNPQLRQLPGFRFADPPESRYRIRKAPRAGQLSTAEAVGHLLQAAEPELDTGPIFRAQEALVNKLLAFVPVEHGGQADENSRPQY